MSRPLQLCAVLAALAVAAQPLPADSRARRTPTRAFKDGDVDFRQVVLSPDGKVVAGRGDDVVRLWVFKTGKLLHRLGARRRHCCNVPMSFTSDGKALIVPDDIAAGDGVRVIGHRLSWWEVKTGKRLWGTKGKAGYCPLAHSPDGKRMLTNEFAKGGGSLCFRDPHVEGTS